MLYDSGIFISDYSQNVRIGVILEWWIYIYDATYNCQDTNEFCYQEAYQILKELVSVHPFYILFDSFWGSIVSFHCFQPLPASLF